MKKILLLVFAISILHAYSQSAANTGEIKRICVDLKMTDEKSNKSFHVRINNRKIIATKKVSGIQTAKKVIKVDKKLFSLLKQALFNKGNLYSLPDTINCRQCKDGMQVVLSVKTKAGEKNISGKDPGEENADMKYIMDYITKMTGTMDEI